MLQLGILLFFCTGVLSQKFDFGKCPEVEVIQNFDVSRYMGLWYENAKYFAIFELGGKCITANYSLNSNGTVHVKNSQNFLFIGNPSSIEGTATLSGNKTEGKLSVVFPSVPGGFPAPYWILQTDYVNYAVVYSCNDFVGLLHAKIVWILTRQREPPNSTIEQALEILKKNNLSSAPLIKTDQKNCS